MTFNIPCTWEMYGRLTIEADTLEQAIEIANSPNTGLPQEQNYIEDSFRVDEGGLEYYNKEDDLKGEAFFNDQN